MIAAKFNREPQTVNQHAWIGKSYVRNNKASGPGTPYLLLIDPLESSIHASTGHTRITGAYVEPVVCYTHLMYLHPRVAFNCTRRALHVLTVTPSPVSKKPFSSRTTNFSTVHFLIKVLTLLFSNALQFI